MPLEQAVSIKDLNPVYPLGTDSVTSADDHIRLIKQVLKNTFPYLDGPVSLSAAALNGSSIPTKGIVMFGGAINEIPSGWFLCDGTNNTPDLRDRFIVGAGSTYAVGAKGGAVTATTATSGAHSHTVASSGAHTHTGNVAGHALTVAELPAHHHNSGWGESKPENAPFGVAGTGGNWGSGETDQDNFQFNTGDTGSNQPHTHGLALDVSGAHTHVTDSAAAHAHTVDTRSPYYALCFIMKG